VRLGNDIFSSYPRRQVKKIGREKREGWGWPVGAGVVWMGSGDACVALAGGGMDSRDQDEGDAHHKASPPRTPLPRPYGCGVASEAAS
jgi:hypothetical protein